jgi:hypothetical protein
VSDGPTHERRTSRQQPVSRPPVRPLGADRFDPDGGRRRTQLIRVADRENIDPGRTSPRMRFDLLQVIAWALGLALVVGGLVAVARAGFEDLGLTDPLVEVGGQPATPMLALLWLLLGIALLAAGTGEVSERGLRIGGVALGIVGAVWLIEHGAFSPYLGVDQESGRVVLVMGVALVASSYVPPLSIARPGVPER